MSHVIYLLCPREKESESEPDWSPRTQSTSTYVAIVRVWSISSLVRAIFIEKHLTLRGACLMNARRCHSSSRWGYNSAHKCGRCTRICKVWLQCAFCPHTWQAFNELWRWFLNCHHFPIQIDAPTHFYCRATGLRLSRTIGGFSPRLSLPVCGSANQELLLRLMWHHLYWPV